MSLEYVKSNVNRFESDSNPSYVAEVPISGLDVCSAITKLTEVHNVHNACLLSIILMGTMVQQRNAKKLQKNIA